MDELVQQLRDSPELVGTAFVRWQARAAPYTQAEIVREIRAQQKGFTGTGKLAGSVSIQLLGRSGFSVGPRAAHSIYFLKGTRPHEIRARNKKALTIPLTHGGVGKLGFSQKSGTAFSVLAVQGPLAPGGKRRLVRVQDVGFAKAVQHPGTDPHDFLTPTRGRIEPVVTRMLREELQAQLAGRGFRTVFGGAA